MDEMLEPMSDLGKLMIEQADLIAQAQLASLNEGIAIGQRESKTLREAARGVVTAHDLKPDEPIPTLLMCAIENLRKALI